MKKLTAADRRREAIKRLRSVLTTVNVGYPYFGVPADVAYALKVLRDIEKLSVSNNAKRKK